MKKFNSFTLAETMLVVIILGIIAVLVVPQLIRRQVEVSNRTKLKKAMAAYDYFMNRMILENDLHSNTALKTWGANCSNSANYFKISQETSNPCVFKTTDGVWWNISNIQQPKVAFTYADLTAEPDLAAKMDNNKAFYFVAHYDDEGIIRISDNAYEVQRLSNMPDDEVTDGDKAMAKLFGFVKNKKTSNGIEEKEEEETSSEPAICDSLCKAQKYKETRCHIEFGSYCDDCYECTTYSGTDIFVYDENGNQIMSAHGCTNGTGENCENAFIVERNDLPTGGNRIVVKECNGTGELCNSSYVNETNSNGIVITRKTNCAANGVKCTSCSGTCVKNSHGYYDPEDTVYND